MKKVLSIFLVLVIISQVFCATAFADSTELQHIQIPCQYIIWFDVYEDIIDGYFIDGSVYVEPSVIEMLTGYTAFQNEGKIVFTPTTSSPTLIYTIDAANEKLTRTAIATETTWDVECIQLGDGTYCVNLEETLLAMNVQIAFSSDEEFSLCTYLPYTVYDAWEEYKNKQFNLFSLTEFGDISSDKISNLGVLSALNSLYLDYNDHFVKDSVLSWWSSDVLNATEDNFKDTMLEILLCMSDEKDGTWGSNPDYKSIKQDTKVLRLAAKMLKLLDVETEEGNIVAVLNATTSFGSKVISLTDFANTISQYKAVQETQRDMLKELFIAFPNYSEPQNSALKYVKNAAMFLSQRLEDNGVGTFSAVCDGVIDLFCDVLEGTISEVTPLLAIVKAVSDTMKGVPGLSNLAEINKHTNVACNSWALLELSTENYVSYRKCVEQYKFPTKDELYRLKLVMLFKIMASVTVRQNIMDAKLSDKSALRKLAQKNTELKSLYALILSSKPIAAPKDNTPTINWEGYINNNDNIQLSYSYEYVNGEFLSRFSIHTIGAEKNAELMFWHDYGQSSSDEDFFFEWEEGKWEYTVLGNRSKRNFLLSFIPTDKGMHIKVTCAEGLYYSWETAQSSEVWIDAEYEKQSSMGNNMSGKCGENATWKIEGDVLYISGKGEMWDVEADATPYGPWGEIIQEIKGIVIEKGVTRIGNCAFCLAFDLEYISIPESVTNIGLFAFHDDTNIHDVYFSGSKEQWDSIYIDFENDPLINATIHYNSTSPGSPESSQAGQKNDSRTTEANFREAIENIQRRIKYDVLSERQKECCRGELFKIDGKEALVLMYYTPGSSDMAPGYYAGLWVANSNGTVSCLTDYRIEAISNSDDAYVTVIIREINGKMYFNPYVRKIIDGKDISKNQYYYIGDTLVLEYDLQSEESIDYIGDGTIQPNDSNSVYFFNQEKTDRSTFYSTQDRLDIGTYILGLDPNWTEGAPPQGYTFEELLAQLPEGTTP